MIKRSLAALCLVTISFAAVRSRAEPQWLEAKGAHYSVFYQSGFDADVSFTRKWLDATQQLMKTKYGVTPDGYDMSIYLVPEPGAGVDTVTSGHIKCCSPAVAGMHTGTIQLLTRSAPVWKTVNLISSLGLPKAEDDYHAKVLVSEYIPIGHYSVQDGRAASGWQYYDAPQWFVQGLQEYDAIFHSTENNHNATSKRLLQWAKANTAKFSCCAPDIAIADAYNGGATFLTFLAAEFGEGVHAAMLRSPAPTFEAALTNQTKPYSRQQLFDRFLKWLAAQP